MKSDMEEKSENVEEESKQGEIITYSIQPHDSNMDVKFEFTAGGSK